jgi:cellulose synthase/poly-beta-1,6-N-acetylglucosamine synthase-like glycosyltransferase
MLFSSIILSFLSLFLIIYAFTLSLFPVEWRKKVNSKPNSLNPKYNNEPLTGILIIMVSAITFISWSIFLYNYLF